MSNFLGALTPPYEFRSGSEFVRGGGWGEPPPYEFGSGFHMLVFSQPRVDDFRPFLLRKQGRT